MLSSRASSNPDRNHTSEEEICMLLNEIRSGSPIPDYVLSDVNPYDHEPSNLPGGILFLISSKRNVGTKVGFWRVKGEACKLFSNPVITGWRTTLEFFVGQAPNEYKTDWIMQEFWITQNAPGENSKFKEAKSLCRVSLSEHNPNHEKLKKMASETLNHATQSSVLTAVDATDNGSLSKIQVCQLVDQDAEIQALALAGRSPNNIREMPPEPNEVLEGDYLELADLQIPVSPSSSENSSCLTMSSDECFDHLDLLRDLESDSNREMDPKHEGCKFNVVASIRADELVMFPATQESFVVEDSHPPAEDVRQTDRSSHTSAEYHTTSHGQVAEHSTSNHSAKRRDEGPSFCHTDSSSSSSNHSSASHDGKGKHDAKGKRRRSKNKYLCFMPFNFLF